ncbi:MAG: hypothetical protein ABS879_07105, partial [Eubacteriales bacterium]
MISIKEAAAGKRRPLFEWIRSNPVFFLISSAIFLLTIEHGSSIVPLYANRRSPEQKIERRMRDMKEKKLKNQNNTVNSEKERTEKIKALEAAIG